VNKALSTGSSGRLAVLLGAGGIRGCAHAGALVTLEEYGVRPEITVGASIGSLFGAAYAAGWSVDRIAAMVFDAPKRAVAEFYSNRLRIDRGTHIGSILMDLGDETRIEDLPKCFACMAIDQESGEVRAFSRGPLLQALQASIALPRIARPVVIDGRRYIDGGLKGPIPSIVARDLGATAIIRVELTGWRGSATRHGKRRQPPLIASASRYSTVPSVVGATSSDEWAVTPRFFGLSCNSPFGAVFAYRRGEKAMRRHMEQFEVG